MLESLFNKVTLLKYLYQKETLTECFSMNIAKFLKTRILKNIVSSLLITNINHCVDNYNKK